MHLDATAVPPGAAVELTSPRFSQSLGRVDFWYYMAGSGRVLQVYAVDVEGLRGEPLWTSTGGQCFIVYMYVSGHI